MADVQYVENYKLKHLIPWAGMLLLTLYDKLGSAWPRNSHEWVLLCIYVVGIALGGTYAANSANKIAS